MRDVFRTVCRLCDERVNFKDCTVYNGRFIHIKCLRDLNEKWLHDVWLPRAVAHVRDTAGASHGEDRQEPLQ